MEDELEICSPETPGEGIRPQADVGRPEHGRIAGKPAQAKRPEQDPALKGDAFEVTRSRSWVAR